MPLDAPTLGFAAVGDGRLLLAAEDGFKLLGKGAKSLEASLAPKDCVDKAKRFEAGAVDGAVAAAAAGERVALARASGASLAKFAEATCDLDVAAVALRRVGDTLYLAAATSCEVRRWTVGGDAPALDFSRDPVRRPFAVAVLASGDVAVGTVDGRVLVFGAAPRDVAVGDGPCLVVPNGAEALAEAGAACFFVRSGVLDLWAGETHLGDLRGNSCW